MQFDEIKRAALVLDTKQQADIKGGTSNTSSTTSILGVDMDVM